MTKKLQYIDELLKPDHSFLEFDDTCYFYGDYTSGKGYSHSKMNSLISNFKKTLDKKESREWPYKKKAVKQIAKIFTSLEVWDKFKHFTWVPIPPSKAKDDPLYDNRLIRTLKLMKKKWLSFDYRELVEIKQSRPAAHESESRPTPQEHKDNFTIDVDLLSQKPQTIVVYDDVLTTGSGFKAMKGLVQENYPDVDILGLFVARVLREEE